MAQIERVTVQRARREVEEGRALLVCAYDDVECSRLPLPRAIPVSELERRAPTMLKDQQIIFYCTCPEEASAVGQAARFYERGFANVMALKGGVAAWQRAGYPMAA